YHFIEVMACPGGCLGGGGQPIPVSDVIRQARMDAIYEEDSSLPIRKSHENPEVQALYEEFLGEPLGHKSHELLHTHYTGRKKF
ncbi:MAG: iron hydrogenase small subunit, partial [Bacteroidota bacterium]